MDISIVIVNYNGAAFIKDCLDSIFASECSYLFEVIVVDNDSSDESVDIFEGYDKPLTLIENTYNYGFSYANNQGFAVAKGHTLFMLNNDTVLKKDTLQGLMDFLADKPHIGAVAPKLLNRDGTIQCPGSSLGHWRFRSLKPRKVSFIAGAAVLIRQSVMDEIGGLDANLYFYNDDIDFCMKLKRNGYQIWYYPVVSLVHFGGLSTNFRRCEVMVEGYRGGIYIAYKHYGLIVSILYRIVLLFDVVPRLIINTIWSLFNKDRIRFRQTYWQVLRMAIQGSCKPTYPTDSKENASQDTTEANPVESEAIS